MKRMHGEGRELAWGLLTLTLALSACSAAKSVRDAGTGGAPGAGGGGGSGSRDAGAAGTGGSTVSDAAVVVVDAAIPDAGAVDAGARACGNRMCPSGQRCCDHCTGGCAPLFSGAFCLDDQEPQRVCADAGRCMRAGESCLTTPCCPRHVCCSGIPVPAGEARCFANDCPDSDYNLKTGFSAVESDAVLEGLRALPLSKWHYKTEPDDVQHIGPMAQDFKVAFGVGADDKHIFQIDADGVSFAAIQALARRIEKLSALQAELARENAALREQLQRLEQRGDLR